jgi:hypothetical protein
VYKKNLTAHKNDGRINGVIGGEIINVIGYSRYAPLISALYGKETGTYDLETGEKIPFLDGYQVTFYQAPKTGVTYTGEEFDGLIDQTARLLSSRVYGGNYDDSPEPSFNTLDANAAVGIMNKYRQESVYVHALETYIYNEDFDPITQEWRN